MKFIPTDLPDAYIVELEPHTDERGFFARMFCAGEFTDHGLEPAIAQANIAFNRRKGTMRGMHYQVPPAAETKYVRCTRGAILDVIIDLRPQSPTYLRNLSVELTADNRRGLYVPQMFAHGYLTLADETEVNYLVSEYYTPGTERGIRYDDPVVGFDWPGAITVISEKDRAWAPFDTSELGGASG